MQQQFIKGIILNHNNQPTGETTQINIDNIFGSPKCACGQTRFICRIINPLCNLYICERGVDCASYGRYQVIPKKGDNEKNSCKFCGRLLKKTI